MYFLLPFLAATLDAVSFIASKSFLRRYGRLTYKEYNWMVFLGILVALFISAQLFDQFPHWLLISKSWLPLMALGLLGAVGNVLFSRSFEQERIASIEPFVVFRPLVVILIASIFFPAERDPIVYAAIAIAGGLLAWANVRHKRLPFNRSLVFIMLSWITGAFEVMLTVHLLQFFPPIALYMLRCIIIFILITFISRPNFKYIQPQHFPPTFFLGVLAVSSVIAGYVALERIGIAPTMFAQVLTPALVYWFSASILKDRWNRKNVIATALIVLLVVAISWWLAR